MKRHFVNPIFLFGFVVIIPAFPPNTAQAEAKSVPSPAEAQRHSVIDYFRLLPSLGIGYPATRQEKYRLLQPSSNPIIDVRHDYLLVHPDSSPAEQVAVFRTHGKADLLAISLPDFESDYSDFALFHLRNGKLRDVTRRMLPMPADVDHLLYELPQFGTTIRVFRFNLDTQSRHHVWDLQWWGGRFIKIR